MLHVASSLIILAWRGVCKRSFQPDLVYNVCSSNCPETVETCCRLRKASKGHACIQESSIASTAWRQCICEGQTLLLNSHGWLKTCFKFLAVRLEFSLQLPYKCLMKEDACKTEICPLNSNSFLSFHGGNILSNILRMVMSHISVLCRTWTFN